MPDLQKLQLFAAEHGFDLTQPLVHSQVLALAQTWLPRIFFYEEEKFHPIALADTSRMVEAVFDPLSDSEKDALRIRYFVRTGNDVGGVRSFDPPVVRVSDGLVHHMENQPQEPKNLPVVRVLNADGVSFEQALELPAVDIGGVITHGASFSRSDEFFGANRTFREGEAIKAGNPLVPRATTADGQRAKITVIASLKNLLETLKYELIVKEADDYPTDRLRGAFDIAGLLFQQTLPGFSLSPDLRREILLALIAAHETDGDISPALDKLPPGWRLNRIAWDTVTRYAFLEYDFYYAYNDFERVQTALFDNEHEGDVEGCCLVFDRNVLNIAAASGDPQAMLRAVPQWIITSVHEEFQNADLIQLIPPPIPPANDPTRLPRQDVDLDVFIAWGSHATYLKPGSHDLVDFQDTVSFVEENVPLPLIIALAEPLLCVAIILAMIEHFIDTEDQTSDTGIRIGPTEVVREDPLAVAHEVQLLPMSRDQHIYMPEHEDLLRLHAFAGNWGAHDGLVDHSGPYIPKTGRYFRKLLASL